MPAPCPERRQLPRRPAGNLTGRVGFAQAVRVLDLSPVGARVATGESLAPHRRYHLQLAGIHLTAEVVRCALVRLEPDEDGARAVFEAGMAFDKPAPEQRRALRRLLASLAPRSPAVARAASVTAA